MTIMTWMENVLFFLSNKWIQLNFISGISVQFQTHSFESFFNQILLNKQMNRAQKYFMSPQFALTDVLPLNIYIIYMCVFNQFNIFIFLHSYDSISNFLLNCMYQFNINAVIFFIFTDMNYFTCRPWTFLICSVLKSSEIPSTTWKLCSVTV